MSTITPKDALLSSIIPSKTSKKQWNFVNISTPGQKKDAAVRKLVRGQAMRDFRQRQRQEQILSRETAKLRQDGMPEPELASTAVDVSRTSHSENEEHEAESAPIETSLTSIEPIANPQTLLSACTSDPFNVYPACNDLRGHRLLSHCEYFSAFSLHPDEKPLQCYRIARIEAPFNHY